MTDAPPPAVVHNSTQQAAETANFPEVENPEVEELEQARLKALIEEYGDRSVKDLIMAYVDTEINRLMAASRGTLTKFAKDLDC